MFRKYGCGCVYLIDADAPTYGCLVDYCGASATDDCSLSIGPRVRIAERVSMQDLAESRALSADESAATISRLSHMIAKGYRLEEARAAFTRFLGD